MPSSTDALQSDDAFDASTISRGEYITKQGERYEPRRPTDNTELLRGDGTFAGNTVNADEYQAKRGERFDTKRPTTSDLWKVEPGHRMRNLISTLRPRDKWRTPP